MYANGFISSLDRIATWITRMALLNLLWVLYSLVGLFVFGVFPATVAAIGVARKWLMGEQDFKIWDTFKNLYLRDFTQSNGIGWILTIVGGVLFLDYKVIGSLYGEISFIIPFAFYLVLFFYSIVIIWSFPLVAHYKAGLFRQLKNAFILGISKIHISIAIMISLFAVIYMSLEMPTIILFFLFSLSALIWTWFTLRVFTKMDRRNEV